MAGRARPTHSAAETIGWLAFVIACYLVARFAFFDIFFVARMHSDAAFHFVLGKIIAETGELFPRRVWFGNDLILLRSQFLIALLHGAGMSGWPLYATACALLVALCVAAVGVAARLLLPLPVPAAMVLAIALFLPTGSTEWDFVLGQQSHLQQVSLALIGAFALTARGGWPRYAIAVAAIFLTAWDSAPRGAFLATGFTLLVLLRLGWRPMRLLVAALWMAMIAGALVLWLTPVEMIGVGPRLFLQSPDIVLQRARGLVLKYFTEFAGLVEVLPPTSPWSLPIGIAKLAYAVAMIGFAVWQGALALTALWRGRQVSAPAALAAAGLVMTLGGCAIVAATDLFHDVRHVLPGLVLVKAGLALWLIRWSGEGRRRAVAWAALLCLVVATSFSAVLARPDFRDPHLPRQPAIAALRDAIALSGLAAPVRLHATFWNGLVYEVFMDGEVEAGQVAIYDDRINIYAWLADRTRFCGDGDALFLAEDSETQFQALLEAAGATPLLRDDGVLIYRAPAGIVSGCR